MDCIYDDRDRMDQKLWLGNSKLGGNYLERFWCAGIPIQNIVSLHFVLEQLRHALRVLMID